MLNGDNNENGSVKTNRFSKKNKLHVQHLYLLINSKKQICTCSTLFCLSFAVVLHDYNAVLYD